MTSLSENFNTLISTRQSDRAYTNQPIEREKIEEIIEAARLAPLGLQCSTLEVYCG